MKKMNHRKWIAAGGGGLVLAVVLFVVLFQLPANRFILDVNPSLEITTNRMEQVLEIEALNEDGREFLEGYEKPERNLEVVINDLVDRMILTGYISGGEDNIVMISVDSDELDSAYIEKINEAIAAFLENRQLEYRILNQGLTGVQSDDGETYEDLSLGKQEIIRKLMEEDEELTIEELREISLKDLLNLAEALNISPNQLFARTIEGHHSADDERVTIREDEDQEQKDENQTLIGWKRATEIALDRVGGGVVVELEYDRDDREYEIEIMYDGYEYDLEIHAYTGEILEFDRERNDDAYKYEAEASNLIGMERAVEIAMEKTGEGTLVEFELDLDDGEYEIEIKYNGKEYEFEIDAYTGRIMEFERDKDDDDWDDDDDWNDDDSKSDGTVIGMDRAIEIAFAKIGGGVVMEFEYDMDDGEYEMEIHYDGYEIEIEMDAYSGRFIEYERDEEDDARGITGERDNVIGRRRAIAIAIEKVGGGIVIEFEYDMDDGEYEIEIWYNGKDYDVEIDAYTGEILDFDD